MGIYHCGPYIAVAKERLNRTDVVVGLQKVRGKRVAEGMGGNALGEFSPADGLIESFLHMGIMKMIPSSLLSCRNMS